MLRNSRHGYGLIARFLHWSTAAAFIAAYGVVYYLLWVIVDEEHPDFLPLLNVHWSLGLLVGALVVPRLIWKWTDDKPEQVTGSIAEHRLAQLAHGLLYVLMIVMPLTGYLGTRVGTDVFGLFEVPSFKDTTLFSWISATWDLSWQEFEEPLDVVHHVLGKWVAWLVVALHVVAAFFHHWVRRDTTLIRMWSGPSS